MKFGEFGNYSCFLNNWTHEIMLSFPYGCDFMPASCNTMKEIMQLLPMFFLQGSGVYKRSIYTACNFTAK